MSTADAQEPAVTVMSPVRDTVGWFGADVSNVGDVTGDGVDDVAATWASGKSLVTVFSGRTGRQVLSVDWPVADLTGGDGSQSRAEGVTGVGDVTGDGVPDIAVGASLDGDGGTYSEPTSGRLYVIDGLTGHVRYALYSPDPTPYAYFAATSTALGDVDGDGTPDIAVGAMNENGGRGRVYVFEGRKGLLLYSIDGPTDNSLAGTRFGEKVTGVGDVDGDGVTDLAVGAEYGARGFGEVSVYSGRTGDLHFTTVSPSSEMYSGFGYSIDGVGDTNGDGIPDLVVGAFRVARAYVLSGLDGALLATLRPPEGVPRGSFGYDVARWRDVDGDGTDDLLVGAPRVSSDQGVVYVVSGRTGSVLEAMNGPDGSALWFGESVTASVTGGGWVSVGNGGGWAVDRAYLYKYGEDPGVSLSLDAPYPNPTRGPLTVTLAGTGPQEYEVQVVDALGRIVGTLPVVLSESGRTSIPLDLSELAFGVYHVVARGREGTMVRSVTVVR